MKRLIFITSLLFSVSLSSQTFTEIFSNDKYTVSKFSDNVPETVIVESENSDTIWVSYMEDLNLSNNKILALDNDLNIISSITYNHPPSIINFMRYKINDKFYGLYYTNYDVYKWDTLQFKCFDKNGNIVIDKPLWVNNNDDTLWINNSFQIMKLSNNNFFLIANANPPNVYNIPGSSAVKFILFDTLGNIINTKTYPLATDCNEMKMCEVGDKIIIDKVPLSLSELPTGVFSTYGMSIINRETLEIEDSIPRSPVVEPDQLKFITFVHYRLEGINDSIFAGIMSPGGRLRLHLFNKNNKQITNRIEYIVEGGDSVYSTSQNSFQAEIDGDFYNPSKRFSFLNHDSIYTCYFVNLNGQKYLELLNFSSSGNLNFTYRFSFAPTRHLDLRGIKATKDGGVVVSFFGRTPSERISLLLKFHPDGLVNLADIETGDKETIKVYPNPARDYINVDIESTNFKQSDIELFDMQGKLVKNAKLKSKQGNRINVSNLNAGAYTYNVSINGKTISGKVIVGK